MDYSVSFVSNLGGALKRFGGDTNAVINSLDSLNNALSEAKYGGGALIEASKKYGLSITKSNGALMNAEELLSNLSNELNRFDKATRISIISMLGIDKSFLRAFNNGSNELNRLIKKQKELGLVTKEDLKLSNDFNIAWLDLKDSFRAATNIIARYLLPLITKLMEGLAKFINYLREHKFLVLGLFSGMLLAMTPLIGAFSKLALVSLKAFSPMLAGGLVIASIGLVLEDIIYYFKGWDSVTGDLVAKFPALKSVMEGIRPVVEGIFNIFEKIMAFLRDPSWMGFLNIFVDIGNAVINTIDALVDKTLGMFKGIGGSIGGFFNGLFGFKKPEAIDTNIPPLPSTNNYANNSYSITNNINQNITSPTPKALGDSTINNIIDSINTQRQQIGGFR